MQSDAVKKISIFSTKSMHLYVIPTCIKMSTKPLVYREEYSNIESIE